MRVTRKGYELSRKYKPVNSLKYGHYQTVHPRPLTLTLLTHPHPIHPTKIFSNPSPPTEKNAPYAPTHPDPRKITSHPPQITHTLSK